jgi:glycosyltransferase involved in cell wall biosynthesis
MSAQEQGLSILQVNTLDTGGGAYRIGEDLHRAYLDLGHDAWLAVRSKATQDTRVRVIPNDSSRGAWARGLGRLERRSRSIWLARGLRAAGQPRRSMRMLRGSEDFDFPGTSKLLDLVPRAPDVVHAHNLHGDYFDLRALPWLSAEVPVFMTLHDAWLLSGHCAHSLDCERWITGCGSCPDLTLYPEVRRDNTASNWQLKGALYRDSRLFVATPSRWLMDRVDRSMLAAGVVERRVIPNGVDLNRFRPGDQAAARRTLGLPEDARVVLFTANGITANPWKDWATIREAIAIASERLLASRVILLGLGETRDSESAGRAEIRFAPFSADREKVVRHYLAADVYLHAARADTFPNTVIEALACGVPVVATGVGGIPEQVSDFRQTSDAAGTGVLAPGRDPDQLADGLVRLLEDSELRRRLGRNAYDDARARFDVVRQAKDYLAWYHDVLGRLSSDDLQLPIAR